MTVCDKVCYSVLNALLIKCQTAQIKCCLFCVDVSAAIFQHSAGLVLWKKEKFWTIFACAAVLQNCEIPHVTFQVVSKPSSCDWGWHLSGTCSWCVLCWSPSCSSLHTFKPIALLRQAAPSDQSLHTYVRSVWSSLEPALSWILSLTQTAPLLQSSVVHFVVAL